jgi:DNA-binding NarL/FixJ family response regulator
MGMLKAHAQEQELCATRVPASLLMPTASPESFGNHVREVVAQFGAAAGLTPREVEVLRLVASGHKNQTIASALGVARPTVRLHIKHLHRKLGTADKVELILQLWSFCHTTTDHCPRRLPQVIRQSLMHSLD